MESNDDLPLFKYPLGIWCIMRHNHRLTLVRGDQVPILEVIEDVSDLCFLGEFGGKGDCCTSRRLDVGTIRYLNVRAYLCWLDVCEILPGRRD